MNAIQATRALNSELIELYGVTETPFEYSTNGENEIITFSSITMWSSVDDERKWNEKTDEYEPLLPYVRKQFNNWRKFIKSLKL